MEKQRLVGLLEPSLISLLERMGIRDDLSLALAQANVKSLSDLRNLDSSNLNEELGLDEVMEATGRTDLEDQCALAIQSARRDLALIAISKLRLDEDEFPQAAGAKQGEKSGGGADSPEKDREKERYANFAAKQASQNAAEQERVRDGPLRQQLVQVTERWHDYLATNPVLGSKLAVEETAKPSWKETVAFSYWMLTNRELGRKFGGESGWFSKDIIEKYLAHARDHVWAALYPAVNEIPRGEWRLYWIRVNRQFQGFFSEKGRQRKAELAASDARASALKAGRKVAEQNAAAERAVAMVQSMLRNGPTRKKDPNTLKRLTQRKADLRRELSFSPDQPLWQHRYVASNRIGASTYRAAISAHLAPTIARLQTSKTADGALQSPSSSRPASQRGERKGSVFSKDARRSSMMSTAGAGDRRGSQVGADGRRQSIAQPQEAVIDTATLAESKDEAELAALEAEEFNANREEFERVTREMIAAQAASKHKGRYATIAAAAAEAAAFMQQQQDARQRKQEEAQKKAQAAAAAAAAAQLAQQNVKTRRSGSGESGHASHKEHRAASISIPEETDVEAMETPSPLQA